MDNYSNTNKLVTYLFLIGLGLSLIFVFFAQERLFNQITTGTITLGNEKYFRSFGVVFLFSGILINLFDAKNKYLPRFLVAYLCIVGYISLNYLFTGPGVDSLTGLMDTKGIGPWIAFGLIFMGYDDKRYALFKKFLFLSIGVLAFYVLLNLFEFGVGAYRGQALSKYRIYATNLVWITPFIFLVLKNKPKLRWLRIFAISIGIISALITLTRSFLLIYILVLLFDFAFSKKKIYYVIGGSFLAILFIYSLINLDWFSTSFDLLVQRGINDTRTNQLFQFLGQVNFFDLIVGTGYESSWNFAGQQYGHLDNQWLLLLWWAGLVPALGYFYLTFIIPIKMFLRKGQDYETRVEAFVLVLWALACAGLSIYTTMAVDFYFFIVCVIQGRLLYKYTIRFEH